MKFFDCRLIAGLAVHFFDGILRRIELFGLIALFRRLMGRVSVDNLEITVNLLVPKVTIF